MSAQIDSAKSNLDLMIAQALKSKSKKQYRVAGVMVVADQAKFNAANSAKSHMGADGEQIVWSQAIASLSSKTITDTITFMNSTETTWWGYRTTEFVVYDVLNQEVAFVGVDPRTF